MPQIQVSGMKLSRGKTQAAAVLLVFCIPFCLFGLIAVGKAVQTAMLLRHDLKAVFMLGAFGLTFNMIGFGLFLAYFYGAKKVQQQRSLQLAYPQQPWMWREDWSRGRIGGTTRSGMVGTWIFAIFWNLVSIPVAFLVGPQAWATDRKGYLVLIFPTVGIILLILALRQTLAWEEFGKTWFDMSTLPGALGRELRGTIQVHFPSTPEQGAALKLSCINRYTTGTGNYRTTHGKILWRDERAVPPRQIGSGCVGSAIPVSFQIPADGVESNTANSDDEIVWVLEANAKVPGVNYRDLFEVPVFHTKDSPSAAPKQARSTPFSTVTEVPAERPRHSRIIVKPAETGGREFDFTAARKPGAALNVTTFFILWSGAIWFMIAFKAPALFPVFFRVV